MMVLKHVKIGRMRTHISVKVSVAWYNICDGIETCKDGSDEHPYFCKGRCMHVIF